MRHILEKRELRATINFTYRGNAFSLDLRRIYQLKGMVCRLVYVPKSAPDARKNPNKPHDIMGAQIAAWFCSKIYKSSPTGVRIVTHGMNTPGKEPALLYTVEREYDLMPPADVEKIITARLDKVLENFNKPDAELPPCDERDRFSLKGDPFAKCRGVCRVRGFCCQYKAAMDAASADFAAAKKMISA